MIAPASSASRANAQPKSFWLATSSRTIFFLIVILTVAGISAAIKQQHRVGKTAGVVNDLTPQVVAGINDGTIYGSNRQHFCNMAKDAVDDFVAVSRGKSVPALTDTGTTFVTKANLNQVLAEVKAGN